MIVCITFTTENELGKKMIAEKIENILLLCFYFTDKDLCSLNQRTRETKFEIKLKLYSLTN